MKILIDKQRHLVVDPPSELHAVAASLGIKRCWFHKDHYDVPKRMHAELLARFGESSPREILKIARK
jgi:hypothetical protein